MAGWAHRPSGDWLFKTCRRRVGEPISAGRAADYIAEMEWAAGDSLGRCSRARGGALAMLVALVAAPTILILVTVVWDEAGGHGDWPNPLELASFSVLAVLSAGLGGWIAAPRVKGRSGYDLGEATTMAFVTYAAAMLLSPILMCLMLLPSVLNGGSLPCNPLLHYQFECPSGLHGLAAIGALITGAIETLPLGLLAACLLLVPSVALILVPALAWDGMVRREVKKLGDRL